jgi:hypothetical protein
LKRYIDLFGRERVVVVVFEDFVRQPDREIERIAGVLNVDPGPLREPAREPRNTYGVARNIAARRVLRSSAARFLARLAVPPLLRARVHQALVMDANKPPLDSEAHEILNSQLVGTREAVEDIIGRATPWQPPQPDSTA